MHPLSSRFLTISQALRAGRPSVSFSGSQLSKRNSRHRQILNTLAREGFFASVTLQKTSAGLALVVRFSYTHQGLPVLRRRYAVSTPGRRIYLSSASL
jgi:ribosomal protein S8